MLEKIKPTNILIGTNFNLFNDGKKSIYNFKFGEKNLEEKVPKEEVYKSFRKSIEKLISFGHNPIILLQPPKPNKDIAKEMKRKTLNLYFKEEWDAVPTTNIDNEVREALKGLNVTFIDLNAKMCKENKCLTFNKNGGLYNGGQHLSYFGAQLFVDDIIKVLK
ncbi:SGNH hydrolase domain-containing protein [Aliarcobacter skirrowii]|uniref:SGNH hydrolase domain-containing protein n=1 Tax=Aliarcobacter skirrowii TaxID=28200 RepID=UPI00320B1AE6